MSDEFHGTEERYPSTPDGRYVVVCGRLWRRSNPQLSAEIRAALVRDLMAARRRMRGDTSQEGRAAARSSVDDAKRALGERGPVWWSDGSPDVNRKMAKNTPYAAWFDALNLKQAGKNQERLS